MILVASHPGDDHAVAVLGALRRAGHPAVLFDTATYPLGMPLRLRFAEGEVMLGATVDGVPLDLATCRAAWWRRPLPFRMDEHLDVGAASWVYQECHEALAGALAAAPATWVNDPYTEERASHKPYQLAVASRSGIPIPRTLITSDPDAARAFVAAHPGGTIYKTFRASEEYWRETRLVGDVELARLDTLRHAPVIFQERVAAVSDLRVTVVGETIFATEMAKGDGYAYDYRLGMDVLDFRPVTLPGDWLDHLRGFMDALGLVYGAIDLMRRPDGTLVFLEVNPSGEWLFVSERTGQPITEAMADLLIRLDGRA